MAKSKKTPYYLEPPVTTLVKLGCIAVHVKELLSPKGHEVDRMELQMLLDDPEIVAWMAKMNEEALLPVMR